MPNNFDCMDDFLDTLREVDILLFFAKNNEKSPEKYQIFNKSCLLFLTAKFEAFLENLIAEYAFKLDQLPFCPSKLPSDIKLRSLNHLLDDPTVNMLRNLNQKTLDKLETISKMFYSDENPPSFGEIFNQRFSYGKHGEKEISKLFQGIGIDDVFEKCKVKDLRDSMDDPESEENWIDFKANINSIIGLRNSIIHGDATPTLTHKQISDFKKNLIQFSEEVIQELEKKIKSFA